MLATLASLRIRNLALVEDLTWQPGPGLVAVTGETGAGKSLLLGALQLLLGERADKSLIRSGADGCVVEAVFEVGEGASLDAWLADQGVEPCADGQLLLKRSLSTEGAGRQFINGSPCTLAALKALGDRLIDLHGPHGHQSLFSREAQTRVLDAYAGAEKTAAEFAAAHREAARLRAEADGLRELEAEAAMRREILSHTANEISAANLREGEEEEVMTRLRAASNSRRLLELSAQLLAVLGGESDSGARTAWAEAVRTSRELARLDPAAEALHEAVEAAAARLAEIEADAQSYASGIESDPSGLRELEARADLIQSLKRKYGGTLGDVLARGEQAARDLEELESRGERLAALQDQQTAAENRATKLAEQLSVVRAKAAPKLARVVNERLQDLGLPRAELAVRLEVLGECRTTGAELAEFEFAPNPGEASKPLRSIASSGEISRVMLALKSVLADRDGVPLLVFDEIDANVGGEVAVKVGRQLRGLSATHQVLCITHLPQVAAAAHRQFAVSKDFDGQRTTTAVRELDADGRAAELARMLGGQDSRSALAHARSLLGGGDQ